MRFVFYLILGLFLLVGDVLYGQLRFVGLMKKDRNDVVIKSDSLYSPGFVKDTALARQYFGNDHLTIGNAVGFSYADSVASAYTELLQDYIFLGERLGIAKIGLSGIVSGSKDSAKTAAQNFFTAGGNASLYMRVPLYYFRSPNTMSPLLMLVEFMPKVSFEIPGMNVWLKNFTYNFDLGIEPYATVATINDVMKFFGEARISYVTGSEEFYKTIGLASENRNSFWLGKWTVGLLINDEFKIVVSKGFKVKNTPGELISNLPLAIGIQLATGKK